MKLLTIINLENVDENTIQDFELRKAARAIVFDENNNVALLPVTKHNYYKLPGGGIEEGENILNAVKRECIEEIGCNIEIIVELGEIKEYRPKYFFSQISYCYIAKLKGEKGIPDFTEKEKNEGFEKPVWVTLEKAIELVSKSTPNDYNGPHIISRDTAFLEHAQKKL